jgi:hypothetical protein
MDGHELDLPDPGLLEPIEGHLWTADGSVPANANVTVRGSPITAEKFLAHATRQAREYSFRGANMTSLSVDLVMAEWPLDRILEQQLATYTRYATSPVADLVAAGFDVLATGRPPHADVVLPALSIVETERLSRLFAPSETRNPYKRRR